MLRCWNVSVLVVSSAVVIVVSISSGIMEMLVAGSFGVCSNGEMLYSQLGRLSSGLRIVRNVIVLSVV